mmetsp:Transcript_29583/g.85621  ORF Transcript_29583/g.85621 Transcript_29583/m.85621 type:complete len:271 (+) Transcript_29583:490-1302(+)
MFVCVWCACVCVSIHGEFRRPSIRLMAASGTAQPHTTQAGTSTRVHATEFHPPTHTHTEQYGHTNADRQTDRHTGSKHTPTRASPAHGRKLSRTRHSATNLYVAADSCGSPLPHGLDQSRSTSYTVLLTATSAAPRSTPGAIGSDPVSEAEERDGQRSHSVRQCGTADVAGTAYRQTDKSTHSVIQTYREKSQVATDTGRRSSTRVSSRGEQEVYSARWCFGQPAGPNCTTHTNTTATRDRFASHRHPILATCVGPARPGQATKYALTHA